MLLYYIVCPAKYRRAVFSAEVDAVLRDVCLEISARHDITFLEIGTDRDHLHFLVQALPPHSPTKIARVIKRLTAREIFRRVPAVKRYLWGGEFWSDGYSISTVGRYGSEGEIRRYTESKGRQKEYTKLHGQQLRLL